MQYRRSTHSLIIGLLLSFSAKVSNGFTTVGLQNNNKLKKVRTKQNLPLPLTTRQIFKFPQTSEVESSTVAKTSGSINEKRKEGQVNGQGKQNGSSQNSMPNETDETVQNLERWLGKEGDGVERIALPLIIASIVGVLAVFISGTDISLPSPTEASQAVKAFFADPSSKLEEVVNNVEAMGPTGLWYFGSVYLFVEILAIPAFALTASAGYLFGTVKGTAVILLSASIAATISFVIGKTILRSYVEGVLEEYPKMQKIDKAIGREGFKLMVLLRLSPFFPFALSNYLYGATSVRFWPYFFGTMLGFTPGTIAYVYTGEVGKALTIGGAETQPWYVYAGGFAFLSGFIKIASDVAMGIIEELEEEEE